MKRVIELNINGDTHEVLVSPNHTLLEVLRDKLGLRLSSFIYNP